MIAPVCGCTDCLDVDFRETVERIERAERATKSRAVRWPPAAEAVVAGAEGTVMPPCPWPLGFP